MSIRMMRRRTERALRWVRGDQAVRLRELGCRLGQGFHFSPPLPADAVPDAVAQRWQGSLTA